MKGPQSEALVFVEKSTVLRYALQVVTDCQSFSPVGKPKVPLLAVLVVEFDRPFHTIEGPQSETLVPIEKSTMLRFVLHIDMV